MSRWAKFKDKVVKPVKNGLVRVIRSIPIISGLPDLHASHCKDSAKEVSFTVLLSTFPLWLVALVTSFSDLDAVSSGYDVLMIFKKNFVATLETGALIVYAASLVSPVIYMAVQEVRRGDGINKVFPSRISHIVFVMIVQMVAAVYFFKDSSGGMNAAFAYYASIWLFPFSVLILFVAMSYKNWVSDLDPIAAMGESEAGFMTGYDQHRRGA
jgi:hypothetical protein